MRRGWSRSGGPAVLGCVVALFVGTPSVTLRPPATTGGIQHAEPLADLAAGVATYVALHRRLDAEQAWPHESVSSTAIAAHRRGLADGLGRARADAAQGDIFQPAAEAAIRQQIAELYPGPAMEQFLDRLREEGPLDVSLRPSAVVPVDAGVASVPPKLLAWLPELPDELEFRFAGRHLVLRDTETDLVVDFVPNIVP